MRGKSQVPTIFANRLMLQLMGPIRRFWALLWDITLTYILHSFCLSTPWYQQFLLQVEMQVAQHPLEFLPPFFRLLLPMVIGAYCLLIGLRILGTLFFGVSGGTWLLGGQSRSNFLWARMGGMIRELLGGLSALLLLGDLPLFWGRKSFKELVSFTKVQARPRVGGWIVINQVLFFPLAVVLALFSPMLENLTFIDGVKVAIRTQKAPRLTNSSDFSQYQNFHSHVFRFTTFSDLAQGRFRLLPLFLPAEVKGEKKSQWSPALIIYDRQNQHAGILTVAGESNLLAILQKSPLGNPLFAYRYPNLQQLVAKDPQSLLLVDEMQGGPAGLLLNQEEKQELKDYLWSAMELNPFSLWEHLLQHGPFVRGHILVRNRILNLVDRRYPVQVSLEKIGGSDFLQIFQIEENQSLLQTLISLEFPLSPIFRLRWQSVESKTSAEDFFTVFWAKTQWYLNSRHVVANTATNTDFSGVKMLDFFLPSNSPYEGKEAAMEKSILSWFQQQVNEVMASDDPTWQQQWHRSLSSLLEVIKDAPGGKYRFTSNFLQGLEKIFQQLRPTPAEQVML